MFLNQPYKMEYISEIEIDNYRAHSNLVINNINNLLVIAGKNDIGKTCILKSLDILFNNNNLDASDANEKDKNITISVRVNSKEQKIIYDYKTNKVKTKPKDKREIKYSYFGTNPETHSKINSLSISQLISTKRDLTNINKEMIDLEKSINMALKLFSFIDKFSSSLGSIFDDFLCYRDIQILFAKKEAIKDIIGEKDSDKLYNIIKDEYNMIDNIGDLYHWCDDDSQSILYEFIENGISEDFRKSDLSSLKYDNDKYSSDNLKDEINEIKENSKKPLFNGTHSFSKSVTDFLKSYGYYQLFTEENDCKKISSKSNGIKKNLKKYIERKKNTEIVDIWEPLLKDFDNPVKIGERGAGIQRLCAIFDYFIDEYRNSKHNCPSICAIEEVEISLHPDQQRKFIKILEEISSKIQIIITTHSPCIIKEINDLNNIKILKKDNSGKTIIANPSSEKILSYPSLSEINYIAFEEPSIEYHQELYGYIEVQYFGKSDGDKIKNLINNLWKDEKYKKMGNIIKESKCEDLELNDKYQVEFMSPDKPSKNLFIPVAVRNAIDHPGDKNIKLKSTEIIRLSTQILVQLWKDLKIFEKDFLSLAKENESYLDKIGEKIEIKVNGKIENHTSAYWLYTHKNDGGVDIKSENMSIFKAKQDLIKFTKTTGNSTNSKK